MLVDRSERREDVDEQRRVNEEKDDMERRGPMVSLRETWGWCLGS